MVCKPSSGSRGRHQALEGVPAACIQTNRVSPKQPQKGMHMKSRCKGYKNKLFDLAAMLVFFSVLTTNRQLRVLGDPSSCLSQQQVHRIQSTSGHGAADGILPSWRHIFRLAKFHRPRQGSGFIPPRTRSAGAAAFPCAAINTCGIIVTNDLLLIALGLFFSPWFS